MNPLVERLGWVLVHSLWQFALLALLAGITVRAMRRRAATHRYGVLVATLSMSVFAPLATWILMPMDGPPAKSVLQPVADAESEFHPTTGPEVELPSPANMHSVVAIPFDSRGEVSLARHPREPLSDMGHPNDSAMQMELDLRRETDSDLSQRTPAGSRSWLAWIVAGWCLGVLLCSLRPLLGWYTLRRLRRVGVSPVSDEVLAALRRISERLELRCPVRILYSAIARVPVVVGYLKPVILLPVSLITNIPPGQLDAILAHELAHIQRHDFIVNLLQTLVETLFFYHPAVWWLSRRIRIEREHCCDDVVVALLGNRIEYGRALLAVEELRGHGTLLAPGATDGSLLSRLRRIVGVDRGTIQTDVGRQSHRWSVAALCLVLVTSGLAISMFWNVATSGAAAFERPESAVAESPESPTNEDSETQNSEQSDESVKAIQSANAIQEVLPPQKASVQTAVLPDHLNVMAVGFDHKSLDLITVSTEKQVSIRTWDVVQKKLKNEVTLETESHGNAFLLEPLRLSGDRQRVIGIVKQQVGIWDAATGKLVRLLTVPKELDHGTLRGLTCTPDGAIVACGLASGLSGLGQPDAHAIIWDGATSKVLRTVQHNGAVQIHCTALSHDGKWLATGGQNNGTCVWDVGTGNLLHAIANDNSGRSHPNAEVSVEAGRQVTALSFSSNGQQLAISDMLGVKLVDATTGKLQYQLNAAYRFGRSVLVYSNDSRLLARVGTDKVVPIWSTQTGQLFTELPTPSHDGSFSDDARSFAVGFTDEKNGLAIWNFPDQHAVAVPNPEIAAEIAAIGDPKPLWCRPFTAPRNEWPSQIWPLVVDDHRVLFGQSLFDRRSGKLVGRLLFENIQPTRLRLSGNGRYLLVSGAYPIPENTFLLPSGVAQVWDLTTSKKVGATIDLGHDFNFVGEGDADVTSDGKVVATGTEGGVFLWDVETGQKMNTAPVTPRRIDALCFSPDGQWLVVSDRNELTYWKWKTEEKPQKIEVGRRIVSLAFSPDSRFLAEGPDSRGDVQIRELQTLQIAHVLRDDVGSPLTLEKMCFSSDGKTLIAVNDVGVDETKLRIPHRLLAWNVASGKVTTKTSKPRNYGWGLDVSRDGFFALRYNESQRLLSAIQIPTDAQNGGSVTTNVRDELDMGLNWGPVSNGLRCWIGVPAMSEDDDAPPSEGPVEKPARIDSDRDVMFMVELQNVSTKPITLIGVRHDAKGQPRFEGKLAPEFFAPHLFEFEFTDANGKPVPRTSRVYLEMPHLLQGALTHEIAPGKSLVVHLRPANFHSPMEHRLPPGIYQAKIRYRGASDRALDYFKKNLPNDPHAHAWSGKITSNEVMFKVRQDPTAQAPAKLVWGEVKDGLQAAIEFRSLRGAVAAKDPPGTLPIKAHVATILHVKNVSDRVIKLVSETSRQGDDLFATNEAGEVQRLESGYATGVPIVVRWTLKPGEVAELQSAHGSVGLIDKVGKYTLRCSINFRNLVQNNGEGEDGFPKADDWQQILITGETPITLRARTPEDDATPKPTVEEAEAAFKKAGIRAEISRGGVDRILGGKDDSVTLEFGGSKVTDEWMPFLLAYPELTNLTFNESTRITDKTLTIIGQLPELRTLRIASSEITGFGIKHLAACQKLTHLRISSSKLSDVALGELQFLAPLKLVELNLGGWNSSDAGLEHVGKLTALTDVSLHCGLRPDGTPLVTGRTLRALAPLQNLTSLELMGNDIRLHTGIKDDDLAVLASLPKLISLNLSSKLLTDRCVPHIGKCQALTSLSLWHAPVSDDGLRHLAGLKQLKSLHLFGTQVTGEGLKHLIPDDQEIPSPLTMLSLVGPSASDAALPQVARMRQLHWLRIGPNGWFGNTDKQPLAITDAGLAALKSATSLTSLELGYAQVTDAGIEVLKECPNLGELSLNRLTLTEKSLTSLAQFPKLGSLNLLDCNGLTRPGLEELHAKKSIRIMVQLDGRQIGTLQGGVARWQNEPAKELKAASTTPETPATKTQSNIEVQGTTKPDQPAIQPAPATIAKPALRITGRVLDAESGQVITKCRMIPTSIYRDDAKDITWQTQYLKDFTDGRFVYETDRPWDKTKLRIEADGYLPATTRVVKKGEVVELDVKLERQIFAGVVRLPDGQLAAKAQVALATWTNEIHLNSSTLSYSGHGAKLRKIVETDDQGRFVIPAEVDPWVAIFTHEGGYAELSSAKQSLTRITPVGQELANVPQKTTFVDLKPWGRIEGRVLMGDTPIVGAKYWVYQARNDDVHVQANSQVVSDQDGRFLIEKIPPGPFGTCQRHATGRDGTTSYFLSGLMAKFDIAAGKTTKLALGSPGRTVTGRLELPPGFQHKIDWTKLNLAVSLQGPRYIGKFGDSDEAVGLRSKFLLSGEGQLYSRKNVAIAADGSFRIDGLPAAEYQFDIRGTGEAVIAELKPQHEILRGVTKITVPIIAPPDGNAAVDVGKIPLSAVQATKMSFNRGKAGDLVIRIIGRIVDADSGEPINNVAWQYMQFNPVSQQLEWEPQFRPAYPLTDGKFDDMLHSSNNFRKLVIAPGYEPALLLDELPDTLTPSPVIERTIRLKKGRPISGILRDHLGKPAVNAQVFFIPQGHRARIVEGFPGWHNQPVPPPGLLRDNSVSEARTNDQGEFTIRTSGPGSLAASTDSVDLWPFELPKEGQSADLQLPAPTTLTIDYSYWSLRDIAQKAKAGFQPNVESPEQCWISIERLGTEANLTQDAGGERGLSPSKDPWQAIDSNHPILAFTTQEGAKLAKGVDINDVVRVKQPGLIADHFRNERVFTKIKLQLPPGTYRISKYRTGESAEVVLQAGRELHLVWNRADGAAVRGVVKLPPNSDFLQQEGAAPKKLDWTMVRVPRLTIKSIDGTVREALSINPDGTFFIATHLEPGRYTLFVTASLPPDATHQIAIPAQQSKPDLEAQQELVIPEVVESPTGPLPVRVELTLKSNDKRVVPAGSTKPSVGSKAPIGNFDAGTPLPVPPTAPKILPKSTLRQTARQGTTGEIEFEVVGTDEPASAPAREDSEVGIVRGTVKEAVGPEKRSSPNPLVSVLQPLAATVPADHFGEAMPNGMLQRLGNTRFKTPGWWRRLAFAGKDEWIWTKADNRVSVIHRESGRVVKQHQLRLGNEEVWSLTASPDGTRVALGMSDMATDGERMINFRVVVLSALTTAQVQELKWNGRVGELGCLSFSGDGETLLTATRGGDVRLWDVRSGKLLRKREFERVDLRDVALSPDGRSAVLAGLSNAFYWKHADNAEPIQLTEKRGDSACFAPNGKLFATVSRDGSRLWDANTGALIQHLKADEIKDYGNADFGIAFTPDSQILAIPVLSSDLIELWDVTSKHRVATLPVHQPRGVAISRDGRWLAASGQDIETSVFDLQSRQKISRAGVGHGEGVSGIRLVDPDTVVTMSSNEALVWEGTSDFKTISEPKRLADQGHDAKLRGLATSPDGHVIVTSAYDDTLGVWDRKTSKRLLTLKGHGRLGGVRVVRFRPDGRQFVSWGDDAVLRWWNRQDGRLMAAQTLDLPGYRNPEDPNRSPFVSLSAAFSPDASSLYVLFEGQLFEFETQTGKRVRQIPVASGTQPLAISADGLWIACGEVRRNASQEVVSTHVILRDRMTLKVVKEWLVRDPRAPIIKNSEANPEVTEPGVNVKTQVAWIGQNENSLVFSPDSKRLAWFRSDDRSGIDIVDVLNGGVVSSIPVQSSCWCLDFSPDGRQLATGHYDSTASIWNLLDPAFVISAVPSDPVTNPKKSGEPFPWQWKEDLSHKPWAAKGKVVDVNGKPLAGVTVTVSTGMRSLKMTGKAMTDDAGNYAVQFGPGVLNSDGISLQAAIISVHKAGFFEKNLSRHGDLRAALKLPEKKVAWGDKTEADVILPNQIRQVDFVMLPAAKLSGTLLDKDDKPLVGYSVSLTGDIRPPASSVYASVTTDQKGQFVLSELSTLFEFQLLIESPGRGALHSTWASAPLQFKTDRGDDLFIHTPTGELEANRFELQVLGEGRHWKNVLKEGAAFQKLEPTGDYLTTTTRVHAATVRLTLGSPKEEPIATKQQPKREPGQEPKQDKVNETPARASGNLDFPEQTGPTSIPKPKSTISVSEIEHWRKELASNVPVRQAQAASEIQQWFVKHQIDSVDIRLVQSLTALLSREEMATSGPMTQRIGDWSKQTLIQIGQPAVVELISVTTRGDANARGRAAECLGAIKAIGPQGIVALVGLLEHADYEARGPASSALKGLTNEPTLIPKLIEASEKGTLQGRCWAIGVLGRLTDERVDAPLVRALHAPDRDLRLWAAEAVMTTPHPKLATDCIERIDVEDQEIRQKLEIALFYSAKQNVTPLLKGLTHDNAHVRAACVRAFDNVLPAESERIIPTLVPLLQDGDVQVRRNVFQTMRTQIALFDRDALVQPLLMSLGGNDAALRADAASVLQAFAEKWPADRRPIESLLKALDDPDSDVVVNAIGALTAFREPEAIPKLVQLAKTNGQTSAAATTALGVLGAQTSLEVLRQNLDQKAPSAIEALGKLHDRESIPRFIELLKDSDESVRAAAATALAHNPDPRSIEPLIEAFSKVFVDQRVGFGKRSQVDSVSLRAIAEALGRSGDPVAIRTLVLATAENSGEPHFVFDAPNPSTVRMIDAEPAENRFARPLFRAGFSAMPELARGLASKSSQTRQVCAWVLDDLAVQGELDPAEFDDIRPALLTGLRDPDPVVRYCLIKTVGRIKLREAEAILLELLATPMPIESKPPFPIVAIPSDPTKGVSITTPIQVEVIRALYGLKTDRARDAMLAALQHPDSAVRSAAAGHLGEFPAAITVEPLLKALSDPGANAEAARVLGHIGDPRAIAPLIDLVKSGTISKVQANAAQSLGLLGAAEGKPALRQLLMSIPMASPRSDSFSVQLAAAISLVQFHDEAGTMRIKELLGSADYEIRSQVAAQLGTATYFSQWRGPAKLSHEPTREVLRHFAEHAPDTPTRLQLVEALGGQLDDVTRQFLERRANDPNEEISWAIWRVLIRSNLAAYEIQLLKSLDQVDEGTRREVIQFLGQIPSPQVTARLLALASDPNSDIRVAVVNAFSKQTSPSINAKLKDLAINDPSPQVRVRAARVLTSNSTPIK